MANAKSRFAISRFNVCLEGDVLCGLLNWAQRNRLDLTKILLIAAQDASRRWEHALLQRLLDAGQRVVIRHVDVPRSPEKHLDQVLAVEGRRFGPSPLSLAAPLPSADDPAFIPDLVIDLAGSVAFDGAPVLQLEFNGHACLVRGLAAMLADGAQPELNLLQDGAMVGLARPMIGDRVWLSRLGDDLMSGAIALIEQALARFEAGTLRPLVDVSQRSTREAPGFWRHYLPFLARGLTARLVHKLFAGRKPFYWQVAYRMIDGPGVAETGALDGPAFTVLPDDGARFYADPFPFEHQGRQFLFVEEFPYSTAKGVISVTELGSDGAFGRPHIVLEEPHHLSYPHIIEHEGEIYMLPEGSAAHELVLYRAVEFPDQWVRDTVLIANRDINDATLLKTGGQFWLIATERLCGGSASDKMVVYSAPDLRGPWLAHALNPIAIDHSAARPGGEFIRHGDQMLLPVQNGSSTYGGGLGLMALEHLDAGSVVFSRPRPIVGGPAWARSGIHTLNRAGRLEVVDSAG